MRKEEALQITTNYYRYRTGNIPENISIKSMEPAGGRIVLRTERFDNEIDDTVVYEIAIEPVSDSITMKQVVSEHSLGDFKSEPVRLSELKPGTRFRMEGDCAVWQLYKSAVIYVERKYGILMDGHKELFWTPDTVVFPCK